MTKKTHYCVEYTTDYNMFKNVEGNRSFNPANVKAIMLSMAEEQLIVPALVNDKLEIIDGQHRLRACEKSGLPFYFIRLHGYGLKQTQRINANMKNWVDNDYLDSFTGRYDNGHLEFEPYAELAQFMGEHDIGAVKSALTIVSNGNTSSKIMTDFKLGNLQPIDTSKAEEIVEMAKQFEPYIGARWKQNTFLSVFITLTKAPFFDFTRISQQLASRRFQVELEEASGVKGWRSTLVSITNYGRNAKSKIDGVTLENLQSEANGE